MDGLFVGGCRLEGYLSIAWSVFFIVNFTLIGASIGVAENWIERRGKAFKIFLYFIMSTLSFILIFPESFVLLILFF